MCRTSWITVLRWSIGIDTIEAPGRFAYSSLRSTSISPTRLFRSKMDMPHEFGARSLAFTTRMLRPESWRPSSPGVVAVIGTRRAALELSEKQIAIIENNSPLPPLRRRPPCYAQSWLRTDGCGVVRLKGIREQFAPLFEPQRSVGGALGIFPVDTFGLISAEKGTNATSKECLNW